MYEYRYPRNGEFALVGEGDLWPLPAPRYYGGSFYTTDTPFTYIIYPGFRGPVEVVLRGSLLVATY